MESPECCWSRNSNITIISGFENSLTIGKSIGIKDLVQLTLISSSCLGSRTAVGTFEQVFRVILKIAKWEPISPGQLSRIESCLLPTHTNGDFLYYHVLNSCHQWFYGKKVLLTLLFLYKFFDTENIHKTNSYVNK